MKQVFNVQGKAHSEHDDSQCGTVRIRASLHKPSECCRFPESDQSSQQHVDGVQAGRKCNPVLPCLRALISTTAKTVKKEKHKILSFPQSHARIRENTQSELTSFTGTGSNSTVRDRANATNRGLSLRPLKTNRDSPPLRVLKPAATKSRTFAENRHSLNEKFRWKTVLLPKPGPENFRQTSLGSAWCANCIDCIAISKLNENGNKLTTKISATPSLSFHLQLRILLKFST